jgi:hypothetical protein
MLESETDLLSNTILNDWINESIQDFRIELSNADVEFHLTSATGTLTAGVVSGTAHGSMPLPDNAFAVYGLDLTVNGQIVNVDPMTFSSRNDSQSGTTKTGVPTGFHITSVGVETETTVGSGTILLSPAPDAAYPYRLYYLPVWTDLDEDDDVFNTIGGGDRWVVWDVCVKVAARINDAKKQGDIALREREIALDRIVKTIKRMNRSGPVRRRDSRGERWPERS